MKQAAYAPAEKTSTPVMVESYVVTATPTSTTNTRRAHDKWLVSSCCCGCSLSTGVYLIALLETTTCMFGLLAAVFAIYLKTQEKRIDNQIYKHDSEEESEDTGADTEPSTEDEMTTDEKVDNVNHMIDIAAYNSPFLILFSLIGLCFCYKGFQAYKGDANAARIYYKWKQFGIFWAIVQMIFGGGFFGFIGVLLAIYYCLVVRSHWVALTATQAEATPAESTAVVITTVSAV
jgi:hypothetical protein